MPNASTQLTLFDESPSVRRRADTRALVWTRIQAEAGQPLDCIVARKDAERRAGGGLFFWGIGSSLGSTVQLAARTQDKLPVVFSRMLSQPKKADTNPEAVAVWRSYIDQDGVTRPLPPHVLVTSRSQTKSGVKSRHYALV